MGALVDRRTTGKDGHGIATHRFKDLYLSAEGIEEPQHKIIFLHSASQVKYHLAVGIV
jgi:hypothetical protein